MYESFSMPNELENIRIQLRHAFDLYCKETAATESLIAALPFPPAGEDLKRLLIQQSKRARGVQPIPAIAGSVRQESVEPNDCESERGTGPGVAIAARA
jgi:hypothetical protein